MNWEQGLGFIDLFNTKDHGAAEDKEEDSGNYWISLHETQKLTDQEEQQRRTPTCQGTGVQSSTWKLHTELIICLLAHFKASCLKLEMNFSLIFVDKSRDEQGKYLIFF